MDVAASLEDMNFLMVSNQRIIRDCVIVFVEGETIMSLRNAR